MRILGLAFVATAVLAACAGKVATDSAAVSGAQNLGERPKPPVLPSASGTGDLSPWGGTDSSRWRPEAILANATSDALNRAWALPSVRDVVVAVPLKMFASQFAEFGDGQLNSVPAFGQWSAPRPQVVATMIDFTDAPRKVLLRFDRTLALTASSFVVAYTASGARKTVELPITRGPEGDFEAEWLVPAEVGFGLLSNAAVAVHPKDWNDWLPLWFRMPVRPVAELNARTVRFSDGKPIFDREGVSVQNQTNPTQTPFDLLTAHSFTAPYDNGQSGTNVVPFNPQDIHSRFPFNGGTVITGVGQGFTWVADERPSAFKVMYTCFERRRPDLEASAPQGGVVSGGGWHFIGDPAETIVNDLEAAPLVVAAAMTNPYAPVGLPSGGFAFGDSDVATFRWLFPGEAFITTRGAVVDDGQGGRLVQDNFHWYYFQGTKNVCTEEIVNTAAVPQNFQP
jgi:hypothetical protein